MWYELLENKTFPQAFKIAEGQNVQLASVKVARELLVENPRIITPNGYICTGTIIAYEEPGKTIGSQIIFREKEHRTRTLLLAEISCGEKDMFIRLHPGSYSFSRTKNDWIFKPVPDAKEIMSSRKPTDLITRLTGNYVGPIFMRSVDGFSTTPSPFEKYNFLLVENMPLEERITEEPGRAVAAVEAIFQAPEPSTTRIEIATPYSNLQHLMNSAQRSLELAPSRLNIGPDVSLVEFLKILRNAKVIEKFMPTVILPCSEEDYLRAAEKAKVIIEIPLGHLDYKDLKIKAAIGSERFKGRLGQPFQKLFKLI